MQEIQKSVDQENYKHLSNILVSKRNQNVNSAALEHFISQKIIPEQTVYCLVQLSLQQEGVLSLDNLELLIEKVNSSLLVNFEKEVDFYPFYLYLCGMIKRLFSSAQHDTSNYGKIISKLQQLSGKLQNVQNWISFVPVANLVFSMQFKLNQFHQANSLFNIIEPKQNLILKVASNEQRLFLHYYMARFSHLNGDIDQLEFHLEKALGLAQSKRQVRKIFSLLLPTRVNLYSFPKDSVLDDLGLGQFKGICKAIQEGDVKTFDEEMKRNQLPWIKTGMFFMYSESKQICYRNLLKKIYLMNGKEEIISVNLIQSIFKRVSEQSRFDYQMTIGVLGGLISKELVKGFINLENKVLVLSKKEPFPELVYEKMEENN